MDLTVLESGLKFFPRNSTLLYRTAKLYAEQGMQTEAMALTDTGTRVAPNERERHRFAELRAGMLVK